MSESFGDIMPYCCELRMIRVFDGARFIELRCSRCGDAVYVKKDFTVLQKIVQE